MGRKGERVRRPQSRPLVKMRHIPDLGTAMLGLVSPMLTARMNAGQAMREHAFKSAVDSANTSDVVAGKKNTFVQQHDRPSAPAGGVNAPCPCNSGRKFKKCHGKAPSYEVQDGNHVLAVAKQESPKVKELTFENLAGIDPNELFPREGIEINTKGAETGRYQSDTPNAGSPPNLSTESGDAAGDNAVNADGIPTRAPESSETVAADSGNVDHNVVV